MNMCSGKLRNEHPYLSTKNGKTKKSWNSGSEIIKKDKKKTLSSFLRCTLCLLVVPCWWCLEYKEIELNQIKIVLHDIKNAQLYVFFWRENTSRCRFCYQFGTNNWRTIKIKCDDKNYRASRRVLYILCIFRRAFA